MNVNQLRKAPGPRRPSQAAASLAILVGRHPADQKDKSLESSVAMKSIFVSPVTCVHAWGLFTNYNPLVRDIMIRRGSIWSNFERGDY